MKKRFLSLFLALVTLLGILPAASLPALAASTVEDALGEIDIFNGGQEMGYLSINGAVRKQKYTYYIYRGPNGRVRETPAYCVNPTVMGVPQTVAPGESIKYIANEKASDPKVVGIVCSGYPHRALDTLGVDDKYQAYYATKMALWCYLIPGWNISNLKVASGLSAADQEIARRVLDAAKAIYKRGTAYNFMAAPKLTAAPDKSIAYPVTVDGKAYQQQVFTVRSETWVFDYDVAVAFSDPASVPTGTRIVDMDNRDITAVTTEGTGEGYVGQFKVLYPAESIQGESGNVQLSLKASVSHYAAMYAVCAEKDKYGQLQNYICDTDNNAQLDAAAVGSYRGDAENPDAPQDETALKIVKLEEGTELPLEGAVFSVYDPAGRKVGSFSTGFDGTVTIPVTLEGHYTVTEEIPPEFHLLPDVRTQHVDAEYNKVATLTFWDAPYGSLRVQKLSDTGDALNGVTVQIKHIESGQVLTGKTQMGGAVVFDRLKPGGYEVREVAGVEGWLADTDTVQTVAVTVGQCSDVTIINKELPGLRIIKYDRKNMALLPRVTFAIYRDGEFLGSFQTDEFGEILLTNARPGTYRAFEVDTGNEGLILDTTPQEVELHPGDGIKELLFFNDTKPGLRLVKVDSADPSRVIPNAVFEIKSVKGDYGPEEFITSQDGEIDLSVLPEGSYVVTEKSCPGYVIDEAQRIIHLDPNEDAQFVFTNSRLPDLLLIKTSADGAPLPGVSFRLSKIEDGSHYLDRTTSATGEILWEGLEPGVYSLVETATVSDHILDLREHHVELFPGKTSEIVLKNQKRPNLIVYKHDADTGEPIPDTIFLVKATDGHSVDEIKTDANGKATLSNLLPGVYEVSEKSVPALWLMDAPSQLVTLYPNRDHTTYFKNHKRPVIEIIKENAVTFEPLENVPFRVWYASNNTSTGELNDLGTFYTDENGRIELNGPEMGELGLRDGWFRVQELEPLKGFAKADPDTQEAFVAAGQGHTFRFRNQPLSAICVWKYDRQHPNQAIEGAVFQIKYLSGNTSGTGGTVIGTYRTSANGSFTVTGLPKGAYIIEELSSDGNHVIDTPPQTVYLSGEEQEVVQVYFGNSAKGSLLVKKVSASDGAPLSDVEFFVTTADGAVVGNANGKFVTDRAGTFLVEGIEPNTTLIVKESRAKSGYLLDDTPQTVQIKAGQTVTLEFRNKPLGNLIIHKLSSADKKTPLSGVQFKITYADGKVVDAEGGKLSSNGLYWTNHEGQIILSNITGTVICTEVESVPGYTIDPNTRTQTVVVNPDDTQHLYFYNNPVGGVEIIKAVEGNEEKRIPNVTFEIRRMDDALVDTVTTGKNGRVFVTLEAGSYYAVETKCPKKFKLDSTPHYFEVKTGKATPPLVVTNKALSGIIIHKTSSTTNEGLYGVSFLVYDSGHNVIDQVTTDDQGFAYVEGLTEGGRYYLRELDNEGYIPDTQLKAVEVKPGESTLVEWKNTPITGQIQITKTSADYNSMNGWPAGTPIPSTVFEIYHYRTGNLVDTIRTGKNGVAVSKPLPLSRYKIVESQAADFYALDKTPIDVEIEHAGQIVKAAMTNKSLSTGVSIEKTGPKEAMSGQPVRYVFSRIGNTSNVMLQSFYWRDTLPAAVRLDKVVTGTYNFPGTYKIVYKVNGTGDYRTLADSLSTSRNYILDASPAALGLASNERVTEVMFVFGQVPGGFSQVEAPMLHCIALPGLAPGSSFANIADVGGTYNGVWVQGVTRWVTTVYGKPTPLPRTGY